MAEHGEVAEGWRKSSRSETGACVEVNIGADQVRVRHSQDRRGPVLAFTHTEWRAFLAGVHGGEFELPAPWPP
jgi:Domain of unknown function (DUF397)